MKVRLGDLERLGAWMDAALAAGFTDVFDVSFSQQVRLREHARVRAVADAREKAGGLAAAFGGRLGPVYSINSLNSMQTQGYGNTALDRIQVTGSRSTTTAGASPRKSPSTGARCTTAPSTSWSVSDTPPTDWDGVAGCDHSSAPSAGSIPLIDRSFPSLPVTE